LPQQAAARLDAFAFDVEDVTVTLGNIERSASSGAACRSLQREVGVI